MKTSFFQLRLRERRLGAVSHIDAAQKLRASSVPALVNWLLGHIRGADLALRALVQL
jgi:hypothetical protein